MFEMIKLKMKLRKAEERIEELEIRYTLLLQSKERLAVNTSNEIHRLYAENKTLRKECMSAYNKGVRDFYRELMKAFDTAEIINLGETKPILIYTIYQETLDEILNDLGVHIGGDS